MHRQRTELAESTGVLSGGTWFPQGKRTSKIFTFWPMLYQAPFAIGQIISELLVLLWQSKEQLGLQTCSSNLTVQNVTPSTWLSSLTVNFELSAQEWFLKWSLCLSFYFQCFSQCARDWFVFHFEITMYFLEKVILEAIVQMYSYGRYTLDEAS